MAYTSGTKIQQQRKPNNVCPPARQLEPASATKPLRLATQTRPVRLSACGLRLPFSIVVLVPHGNRGNTASARGTRQAAGPPDESRSREKGRIWCKKQNEGREAVNILCRMMQAGARISSSVPTQALISQAKTPTKCRLDQVKRSPLARGKEQRDAHTRDIAGLATRLQATDGTGACSGDCKKQRVGSGGLT